MLEISISRETTLRIKDEVIEEVKNIKYLGFIIQVMKFKDYMEYICKKW